ncbi:hypothetical protein VCHA53O466_50290 [Vibrio chagasii]|nr:hypothetical protein VCHA53O466_50290 [Vibrio chagasii]
MVIQITEDILKKDKTLTVKDLGLWAIVNSTTPLSLVVFTGKDSKSNAENYQLMLNLKSSVDNFSKGRARCA